MELAVVILLLTQMFGLYFGKQQNDLKCLVCQKVVESIISSIEQEDPKKKIQVGSFRIEPDGSQKQYEVKYAGSEVHLNEILENVCNSLDDYAQAKHKETGALTLLNLAKEVGKLSLYDLVPDPELNRGLKSSCETFVGDYDDEILAAMQGSSSISVQDSAVHLCEEVAAVSETAIWWEEVAQPVLGVVNKFGNDSLVEWHQQQHSVSSPVTSVSGRQFLDLSGAGGSILCTANTVSLFFPDLPMDINVTVKKVNSHLSLSIPNYESSDF